MAMWIAGCAGQSQDLGRFVPQPAAARAAVEQALKQWQNKQESNGLSFAVEVVDTQRKPNQRLEDFEILGEAGSDAGRCFSVRLTLDNPSEQQTVRFTVIGINPIWVFREEDFTMLTHWDCMRGQTPSEPKD
jgi:hypothetical protein